MLEEDWTLSPDEHALLVGRKGSTRLGFAVLVRFFNRHGHFPDPEEIDEKIVEYVAGQIDVPATEYRIYDHHGRTAEYHRSQIRDALGFRPATTGDADELAAWLLEEAGRFGVTEFSACPPADRQVHAAVGPMLDEATGGDRWVG